MAGGLPFRVWLRQEERADRGFTLRFVVRNGIGAVQLRPSFVTSPTQSEGRIENLTADEVSQSWLLYQLQGSGWEEVPIWSPDIPPPETCPVGTWKELSITTAPVPSHIETEPSARGAGRAAMVRVLKEPRSVRRRKRERPKVGYFTFPEMDSVSSASSSRDRDGSRRERGRGRRRRQGRDLHDDSSDEDVRSFSEILRESPTLTPEEDPDTPLETLPDEPSIPPSEGPLEMPDMDASARTGGGSLQIHAEPDSVVDTSAVDSIESVVSSVEDETVRATGPLRAALLRPATTAAAAARAAAVARDAAAPAPQPAPPAPEPETISASTPEPEPETAPEAQLEAAPPEDRLDGATRKRLGSGRPLAELHPMYEKIDMPPAVVRHLRRINDELRQENEVLRSELETLRALLRSRSQAS